MSGALSQLEAAFAGWMASGALELAGICPTCGKEHLRWIEPCPYPNCLKCGALDPIVVADDEQGRPICKACWNEHLAGFGIPPL